MRNISLVIKNNLYRIVKDKILIFMVIIVLPIMICIGIYTSKLDDVKGQIAIVGANSQQEESIRKSIADSNKLTLKFLKEKPTNTELIKGIYLAEINFKEDEIDVISYRNEEIKRSIEANMKGEIYEANKNQTTVQGKIIGFLAMFLLMGALFCMGLFVADRENSVYSRVLSGRLSYYEYIAGQIVGTIIILTLPTIVMSLVILKILSIELSISIGLFIRLIFFVALLSSAFSMLICTVFEKKSSIEMGGSGIAMITSILGGCFVNIVDNNKIVEFIRNCIPQKRIIDLANNYNTEDLIFLAVVIIVFILISVFIGKRQYENGTFV